MTDEPRPPIKFTKLMGPLYVSPEIWKRETGVDTGGKWVRCVQGKDPVFVNNTFEDWESLLGTDAFTRIE